MWLGKENWTNLNIEELPLFGTLILLSSSCKIYIDGKALP